MVANVSSVPSAASSDGRVQGTWRHVLVVAALAFALFLFGAAVIMALFDLFQVWVLVLAAVVNLAAMLPICALTALALEVGPTREDGRPRRTRVGQRTLKLASAYWAAGGTAFLLAPTLLFVSRL